MPRSSPSACATISPRRCPERRRRGRRQPPLRAISPSRGGCGHALGCAGTVRHKRASTILLQAGCPVEFGDQCIPGGCRAPQVSPKALRAPLFERLERYTLLLDPGVVAEIEDARALGMGQFEHIVVGDAEQMLTEHFARADRVKVVG